MKSEAKVTWTRAGRDAVFLILLLTAALAGCASERIQHAVSLHYEGTDAPRLFPSHAPPIIVPPFKDHRLEQDRLGIYYWPRLTVDLIPRGGTASEALTGMAREFLQRMGMKPVPGHWDGEAASLGGIEADYALYGEILALYFTGEGNLRDAANKGKVKIEIRLGSRANRTVVRRSVEVAPDEVQFILFDNRFEHVKRIEQVIRRSVSRAVRDCLTDLVRRVSSEEPSPAPTPEAPAGPPPAGERSPFERFRQR
jgi:hypothetical protein